MSNIYYTNFSNLQKIANDLNTLKSTATNLSKPINDVLSDEQADSIIDRMKDKFINSSNLKPSDNTKDYIANTFKRNFPNTISNIYTTFNRDNLREGVKTLYKPLSELAPNYLSRFGSRYFMQEFNNLNILDKLRYVIGAFLNKFINLPNSFYNRYNNQFQENFKNTLKSSNFFSNVIGNNISFDDIHNKTYKTKDYINNLRNKLDSSYNNFERSVFGDNYTPGLLDSFILPRVRNNIRTHVENMVKDPSNIIKQI